MPRTKNKPSNEVVLRGTLTDNPDVWESDCGKAIGTICLKISRWVRDRLEAIEIEVDLWGKTAEIADDYLAGGDHVYVGGRIRFGEDAELRVFAESLQILKEDPVLNLPAHKRPRKSTVNAGNRMNQMRHQHTRTPDRGFYSEPASNEPPPF